MFNTIKSIIKKGLVAVRKGVMWVMGKAIIKDTTVLISGVGAGYLAGAVVKGVSFGPKANVVVRLSVWLAGVVLVWSFTQFVEKLTVTAFDTQLESLVTGLTTVINLL